MVARQSSKTKIGLTRASSESLTSNTAATIASSTIVIIIAKSAHMAMVVAEATTTTDRTITMATITGNAATAEANSPLTTIATMAIVAATEMAATTTTVVVIVVVIEAMEIKGTISADNNQTTTNSTKTQLTLSLITDCTTRMILTSSARPSNKKKLAHTNSRFTSSSLRTTKATSRPSNWTSAKRRSRCRNSYKVLAPKVSICSLFPIDQAVEMTN